MEKLSTRRRIYDRTMRVLLWLAGGITCALLAFMIGYIFFRGIPNLTWPLVSGQTSYLKNTIGIFPNIVNTLYIILVAMVLALPVFVCLRGAARVLSVTRS